MKQEWQRTLLAVAVACACGAATLPAQALTLGRITVQSALGQPLQAEVDLPDITPEEARTLQATIAGPEAFRAAGLDYSPALAGVRITPQRRADGRMVLRVSSEQPVQAPFIDLILQANWAAGRVVRDYTLLLDAPSAQGAVAPATAPQLPPAASPPVTAAAPPSPSPAPPPQPVAAPPVTTAPAAPPPPPASPPTAASAESLTVRRGDTAGRIAASNKAPEVSLDQMLVAMLRNNPQAFISGNVNLLRAGSVLDLPSAEQAASIPQPEAARTIAAQARDFNAYRSRLAGQVAAVPGEAERSASGRVQAQVEEARPAAAATDKLTLSKGGAQARAREEQIARDKAASDSSERVAELSRNIEALNKLGAGAAPAQPPAAAPEPAPASAPVPAPAPAPAPAPEPSPAATVEAPVPSPAPLPPAPAPQTDGGEGGLPGWLPAAGLALAALLAGLFVVRSRRRRATVATPAAPGPADALVASSGGQHVDTESAPSGPSTLSYSLSQFDANEEVDPIAEADVYLAYGRDLQAEEILKEALRTTPERVALHVKLAEIYDKRRDAAAFVKTAEKVHALTSGSGADWDRVAAWGRDLQPDHALWRSSATAVAAATATATAAALAPAPGPADTLSEPGDPVAVPPPPALDIDLDLDLDDLQPPPPTPSTEPLLADSLDFDVDASSPPPSAPAADPLPFDLGSLSLDLGDAPAAPAANAADAEPDLSNPLATKLALAEEFQAIGDADGARALAEEVLAEAEGPLKVQAQRFLAELG